MSEQSFWETSTVVDIYRRLLDAASPSAESRIGGFLHTTAETLRAAVVTSVFATLVTRLIYWTRNSFLYRWLTAEPDPETIVIDLRETYTVGPVLAVLDRLVTTLAGAWETAGTGSLVETTRAALRDHPVRMVSTIALVALLSELVLLVALGELTVTEIVVRLPFVALAALGTRIRVSWEQCTESVTYRYLVAALEPPEPPESNEYEEEAER